MLGISSGASTGAAIAIIFMGSAASMVVAGSVFIGAFGATVLVLWLGSSSSGSPLRLVLAGVAIGFIFHALTNLIIISANMAETARSVVFWSLGSLTRAGMGQALTVLVVALVLTLGLWVISPYLDALASGDKTCLAIGLNPTVLRMIILVPVSAAVALAVATSAGSNCCPSGCGGNIHLR